MKRIWALCAVMLLLTGCAGQNDPLAPGLALREQLLGAAGCGFTAEVTADYGDKTYTFTMDCTGDGDGNMEFTVTAPDTIQGIRGVVSGDGGRLTFDGKALAFSLLADGEVTPVSAPWLLLRALRGGYLRSGGTSGEMYCLTVDDSYQEDALRLEVWLDGQNLPVRAEAVWQGRRILSISVENFAFL